MKRILEIIFAFAFVILGTALVYGKLSSSPSFWNEQSTWSFLLIVCWFLVACGYFHQGWMVRSAKSSSHVSIVLPITVFFVQCILFVKGVSYNDWSLIAGAVVVNSGVLFNLYQIIRARKFLR
jgi:hypothetical protein